MQYIPEDNHLHARSRENLVSHLVQKLEHRRNHKPVFPLKLLNIAKVIEIPAFTTDSHVS
jgi:hypothetical protein